LSVTGHRKPIPTKVFFERNLFSLGKGEEGAGGKGVGDYPPPVNSSEFLVWIKIV